MFPFVVASTFAGTAIDPKPFPPFPDLFPCDAFDFACFLLAYHRRVERIIVAPQPSSARSLLPLFPCNNPTSVREHHDDDRDDDRDDVDVDAIIPNCRVPRPSSKSRPPRSIANGTERIEIEIEIGVGVGVGVCGRVASESESESESVVFTHTGSYYLIRT